MVYELDDRVMWQRLGHLRKRPHLSFFVLIGKIGSQFSKISPQWAVGSLQLAVGNGQWAFHKVATWGDQSAVGTADFVTREFIPLPF